jgi:hypothetical protein
VILLMDAGHVRAFVKHRLDELRPYYGPLPEGEWTPCTAAGDPLPLMVELVEKSARCSQLMAIGSGMAKNLKAARASLATVEAERDELRRQLEEVTRERDEVNAEFDAALDRLEKAAGL